MLSSSSFALFTQGIDVSGVGQQFEIDWQAVRDSGRRFAYYKANTGEGKRDPWFERHAVGGNAAGLLGGAYHFALVDDDPTDDVDAFLDSTAGVALDLPPLVDLETRNGANALSVLRFLDGWVERFEARTGKIPGLYTGPAFWRGLGAPATDPRYLRLPLAVAQYGVSAPSPLAPWADRWSLWQRAGNTIWRLPDGSQAWGPTRPHVAATKLAAGGTCPGVRGEVDDDLFAGSYDDLRRWAGLDVAGLASVSDDPRVRLA